MAYIEFFPINAKGIRLVCQRLKSKEQALSLALFAAKLSLGEERDRLAQDAIASTEAYMNHPDEQAVQRALEAAGAYTVKGWNAPVSAAKSRQMAACFAAECAGARTVEEAAAKAVDAAIAASQYHDNRDTRSAIQNWIDENIQ